MSNTLSTDKQIAIVAALAATRAYALGSHETDEAKKRHVAVLHIGPVTSALAAVQAAIVQEFKNAEEEG